MAMNSKMFREREEFKRGQTGERIVAAVLQNVGWYIIPSYDYSGDDNNKAPKMEGKLKGFVLPDLDICKNGERRWAEVKTKAKADWTRTTQRFEHGINYRLYQQYREVQKISGCLVWIFIYEETTGEILFAKLDDLEKVKRIYPGTKMGRGGMVFWPREKFRIAKQKITVDWCEQNLK